MFHLIECSHINFDDTTFLMSYPLVSPQVIASVGTIGVMQPILVSGCACEGKYQIIAGFRRAYACRELGLDVVHANIYPVDPENPLAAFCLALYENLAHRRFNDIEKAMILKKLIGQFQCPGEDVIQDYMPLLGLASNDKVLEIYLKLAEFDDNLKQYIVAHDFPLALIELLASLSPEDRQAVFTLAAALKLGVNKVKELATHADEIARRDGCSLSQILADPRIQEILRQAPTPQKAEQVRRVLREKRYPQLTALERNYQETLKRLHLPHALRMQTDPNFEDDDLAVTFRFQTPEQLQAIASALLAISKKEDLLTLLSLIENGKSRGSEI